MKNIKWYILTVAISLISWGIAYGWGILPAISNTPGTNCTSGGNDSDTVLLIHSNTTDGSVTFVDSGQGANCPHAPFTVTNDVHHETDQQKFGTTSIYFDGSDALSLPDHTDWDITTVNGNDDFGVGFWIRLDGIGAWKAVIGNGSGYISGTYSVGWGIVIYGGDTGHLAYFETDGGSLTYEYRVTPTLNANTWYHIEVNQVAPSVSVAIYVDGVAQAMVGETGSQASRLSTDPLTFGREPANASAYLAGYLDEIIIKKGVYLHNANFTPPAYAYCD